MAIHNPFYKKYQNIAVFEAVISAGYLIGAILSFLLILISSESNKKAYDLIEVTFLINTIFIFILSGYIRYVAAPSTDEKLVASFFSRAYNSNTSLDNTNGYYNDSESVPGRKIAAQLRENLLFTKNISKRMFIRSTLISILYLFSWLALLAMRETNLAYITLFTQILFSEEIIMKWVRLAYLSCRTEYLFNEIHRLIVNTPPSAVFYATILEKVTVYERIKAISAITLSSRIFEKLNPDLSQEWEVLKAQIGIKQ